MLMQNIHRLILKHCLILIFSVLVGFIVTLITQGQISDAENIQEGIASEIIRFHVIANSDSNEDQELKMKIKNEIISQMKEKLEKCTDITETRRVIEESTEDIKDIAYRVIKEEGYSYDVNVYLTKCDFPIKVYGDLIFPAGEYEALRIEIGEGIGKNWWCVIFPTLCFVDDAYGVVNDKGKEDLKNLLTEEEYTSITNNNQVPIKVRFKIFTIFNKFIK